MKTWCLVAAAVVVLGVSAAAQKPAGDDAAAVAKVRADYEKAANAQDFAAMARLYAPDGVEMPPNAPAVKGRGAIEAYHKKMSASMTVSGLRITSTDTRVSGDVAYDVGTYAKRIAPKGAAAIDDRGKYVVILKKTGGTWAVAHAIYNSDMPAPK